MRGSGIMNGELVFAGTHVEVKILIDYLKSGHLLDDFSKASRLLGANTPKLIRRCPSKPPTKISQPARAGRVGRAGSCPRWAWQLHRGRPSEDRAGKIESCGPGRENG